MTSFAKKMGCSAALVVLLGSSVYAAGFVWEPTLSTYRRSGGLATPFYALNPLAASFAGLGTGEGYGTVAADGVGNPFFGTTAYGGPAPDSLIPEGINERDGHFYFGFANTYPNTNDFSAYEVGGTIINDRTFLDLWFRRTTDDPINFTGMCSDTVDVYVSGETIGETDYLRVQSYTVDPAHSTKGGADQDSVFGLYVNYGSYDADNEGVDYDGALFSTNIHWWDIDVPDISQAKLASIRLATNGGVEAEILANIPHTYFDRIGLDPNKVRGYVDQDELPLGQGNGGTHEFYNYGEVWRDLDLDGVLEPSTLFKIFNDQWSAHDIGFGIIPEPASALLLALAGLAAFIRRRP